MRTILTQLMKLMTQSNHRYFKVSIVTGILFVHPP